MNLKSILELLASSCLLNDQASNMKCKNVLFFSGKFFFFIEQRLKQSFIPLRGRRKVSPGPVRRVCSVCLPAVRYLNDKVQ